MTKRKAIKGGRKRRLARLPSAILPDAISGPVPKWEPTTADWQHIETPCSVSLTANDQEAIGRLVASYFEAEPYEPSAPFVADVKKWLAKVHKPAEGFHQALGELEAESERAEVEIERDAALHAKVLIELRLKFLKNIGDFRNATADFLAAAFHAKNDLKDYAGKGFVEGEAWKRLVIGLAQWFKGKGLRVTAAKSQTNSKQSAFVAFVHALQSSSTFPNRLKRHMASEALPKAINDALKKHVP